MTNSNEAWKEDWAPLIARVGQSFGNRLPRAGAERIELSAIRRFLEVLEFDAPIHHDVDAAREAGYADVIAPVSSLLSFTIPPLWEPGMAAAFIEAGRDAQPTRPVGGGKPIGVSDRYPSYFATDMDFEYLRPVVLGERLARGAPRLVSCEPKQTKVGRGAFIKFETDLVTETGEVVAKQLIGMYVYAPTEASS